MQPIDLDDPTPVSNARKVRVQPDGDTLPHRGRSKFDIGVPMSTPITSGSVKSETACSLSIRLRISSMNLSVVDFSLVGILNVLREGSNLVKFRTHEELCKRRSILKTQCHPRAVIHVVVINIQHVKPYTRTLILIER